jgi:FkbM family methyltransferase
MTIYRYGFYEEGVTKMLLNYLKPGMTFIDIGAHVGYFSLLSSALVGEKGQVHSFEPTPGTFNILKCNASEKSNITVNNSAMYSKKGTIVVNDYGDKYAAYNSIYDARLPEDISAKLTPAQYEIETISVDEYVGAHNIIPDFIKIDAESSEYEILLGMECTIHDFHPLITLEVGDDGVNNAPLSLSLVEFLVNRGYKAFEFRAGNIVPHLIKDGKYRFGNILFLPNQEK